jgi:hypothetical protein
LRRSADLAFRRGDRKEAEQLWRESIETGEAYLTQHPENGDARSNLCWAYADLADTILLPSPERIAKAEPLLQQGLKHSSFILAANPKSGQAREVAAFLHCRLGQYYSRTGDGDAVADHCRQAVTAVEALCSEVPWNHSYWLNAIYIHDDVMRSLQAAGRANDSRSLVDSMHRWLEQVVPRVPDELAPQADLARCREQLVRLHQMTSEVAEPVAPPTGSSSP